MIRMLSRSLLMLGGIALIMAGCSGAESQEEANEQPEETYFFAEGHAPVWETAIEQVVAIAEAMPEEAYGWTPHDSIRTFAGQLMHIANSSKFIAYYFLKDTQPEGGEQPDPSSMTKEEIIAAIRADLGEVGEILSGMSDQMLMEVSANKSFAGNSLTRLEGALFVHDHLTNHKAKANLYIRIHGQEPPAYNYY